MDLIFINNMSRITDHGGRRIKDRLGLGKKLYVQQTDEALQFGIKHSDLIGSLKKYVD